MTLAERIKEQRKKAGMSQEKVAELVGVSRQAVTKWESGQSVPSTQNLFKLAEIFGTTVDILLWKLTETKKHQLNKSILFTKLKKKKRLKRRKKNVAKIYCWH